MSWSTYCNPYPWLLLQLLSVLVYGLRRHFTNTIIPLYKYLKLRSGQSKPDGKNFMGVLKKNEKVRRYWAVHTVIAHLSMLPVPVITYPIVWSDSQPKNFTIGSKWSIFCSPGCKCDLHTYLLACNVCESTHIYSIKVGFFPLFFLVLFLTPFFTTDPATAGS